MRILIAITIGFLVTIGISYGLTRYQPSADFSGLAPKDEVAAGERVVELIRKRQFDAVVAAVDPSIRKGNPAVLDQMAGYFPKGEPFTIRVTGWKTSWSQNLRAGQPRNFSLVQFLYTFRNGSAARATFTFNDAGGAHSIVGINIAPVTAAQMHQSEFFVTGLDPGRVVALAVAIAIDTFAIAMCVLCLMGPLPRWRTRWLLAIATLIGLVRINFVWATGQAIFVPMSIVLPPAELSQIPIGSSWILGISVPVGAIVYLSLRASRGWGNRREEPST